MVQWLSPIIPGLGAEAGGYRVLKKKKKPNQQQHKQNEKSLQIDLFVQSLAQLAEGSRS